MCVYICVCVCVCVYDDTERAMHKPVNPVTTQLDAVEENFEPVEEDLFSCEFARDSFDEVQ